MTLDGNNPDALRADLRKRIDSLDRYRQTVVGCPNGMETEFIRLNSRADDNEGKMERSANREDYDLCEHNANLDEIDNLRREFRNLFARAKRRKNRDGR